MIVCFICHRERTPEQLDGRRCADRISCYRHVATQPFGRRIPKTLAAVLARGEGATVKRRRRTA